MEDRIYEELEHPLTEAECRDLGMQLARAAREVYNIERAKAASSSDFAARLKQANKLAAELSETLTLGYVMRATECVAVMDTPRPGTKQIVRCDTGAVVREVAMTDDERQQNLFENTKRARRIE